MSVVAAALRELMALGVAGDALVAAVERIETAALEERAGTVREAVVIATRRADDELAARKAKAAERTRKHREKKNACSVTVTPVTSPSVTVTQPDASASPAPTCTRVVTPSLPSLRSEELERSPLPSVVAPRHAKPNGFARFWEAYPKKVAKGAAEKAFAKALKRLKGHDPPGQLVEAVHRAKLSRQWLEGYVPNPATWLNDARWEDEIEPPREPHERTHPDPKFTARQANLATLERGADLAARLYRDP